MRFISHPFKITFLLACVGFCLTGCPEPAAQNNSNNTMQQNNTMKDMAGEEKDQGDKKDTSNNTPDQSDQSDNNMMAACKDVTVYVDKDGDGVGVSEGSQMKCLKDGEPAGEGYARVDGDCDDTDVLRYKDAEGVCGDNVDDSCDGKDETCPTSMPMQMNIPDWDCTGTAPDNVYAHARFDDGGTYFKAGGCFIFFEGSKDIFYVKRQGVERATPCPGERYGCTCPSLGGWPSYDRRLYAYTTAGDPASCEKIALVDHAGEKQVVSNACRKYLYQLHRYDIPYSHLASSLEALEARLKAFDTVEIACLEDAPHKNLPFKSLLNTKVVKNDGFKKM